MVERSPGESRALLADMTWKSLDSLETGDRVITFDETPTTHRYRMYRAGEVTEVEVREEETVRISTTDVDLHTAASHRLLVKKWNKSMFSAAAELEAGDDVFSFCTPVGYEESADYKRGYILGAVAGDGSVPGWKNRAVDPRNGGSYVSSVDEEVGRTVTRYGADVFPEYGFALQERTYNSEDESAMMAVAPSDSDDLIRADLTTDHASSRDFARGWLAGMFDTDGTFPEGKELGYCQYRGEIFDRVCDYLDLLGYEWSHDEGERGEFSDKIRLTPGRETGGAFRHLMEIRPKVNRKRLAFTGHRRIGGRTEVTAVEPGDRKQVYSVDTTEGTVITEGLLSVLS